MTAIAPTPAEFFINDVATVAVDIVGAVPGGEPTLTLAADPSAWETIDLLQLFNLRWDARHEGAVAGDAGVEIVVRLDVDVDTSALPTDPGELAAFVAAAGGRDETPWRDARRWFALEVTEAVDVPAELAELGEVRSGFTTTWADAAN